MSPVDRAGPVSGMNFALGSYEKFQPGFRDEKRLKQFKWDVYDVENTAGNARRCHPDRQNSFRFHPGNRDEVLIWQNFEPPYRDLGWKNRDIGNRASPLSLMDSLIIL